MLLIAPFTSLITKPRIREKQHESPVSRLVVFDTQVPLPLKTCRLQPVKSFIHRISVRPRVWAAGKSFQVIEKVDRIVETLEQRYECLSIEWSCTFSIGESIS